MLFWCVLIPDPGTCGNMATCQGWSTCIVLIIVCSWNEQFTCAVSLFVSCRILISRKRRKRTAKGPNHQSQANRKRRKLACLRVDSIFRVEQGNWWVRTVVSSWHFPDCLYLINMERSVKSMSQYHGMLKTCFGTPSSKLKQKVLHVPTLPWFPCVGQLADRLFVIFLYLSNS